VSTSEEKIADVNANAPVGTTQALIEQGAAVFSSIHARLHQSQARVLKILCRLNRWHFDEMRKSDVVADLEISREDFQKNTDVIPVSDPHIFSETQRMAQMQAVLSLADKHPQQFSSHSRSLAVCDEPILGSVTICRSKLSEQFDRAHQATHDVVVLESQ